MGYHKSDRRVCVVGVGHSAFFNEQNTELKGYSLQDIFSLACMEAMEDAGLSAREIDKLSFGMIGNFWQNGWTITQNAPFSDLIGMAGKETTHHEEACAAGYTIINEAINDVASGKVDVAMAAGVDFTQSGLIDKIHPSHIMHPQKDYPKYYGGEYIIGDRNLVDNYFTKFIGGDMSTDELGRLYMREYGISFEEMLRSYDCLAISNRRNASLNPKALYQETYADLAKKAGLDSELEWMKKYDPKITQFMRLSSLSCQGNGAGAVIVTTLDRAQDLRQKPVEVLGMATYTSALRRRRNQHELSVGAVERVYEMTGVRPEEIDLMDGHLTLLDQLDVAEAAGFVPKGEGWKYAQEGRFAFDGDRPMCTDGGTTSYGHAYAGSGPTHYAEQVRQLRGQAGERQVKDARTSLLVSRGGSQNSFGIISRVVD